MRFQNLTLSPTFYSVEVEILSGISKPHIKKKSNYTCGISCGISNFKVFINSNLRLCVMCWNRRSHRNHSKYLTEVQPRDVLERKDGQS